MIYGIGIFTAVIALLVGLMAGKRTSQLIAWGALSLASASFVMYVVCINNSRVGDWVHWRNMSDLLAGATAAALYAAAGVSGPSMMDTRAGAIAVSTGSIAITLTFGTVALLMLACGFAGECM